MLAEKRQQKRCRFSARKRCRFLATCVFEVRFAVRSSPGLRGGLPKNGNVFVAVFRQAFLAKSVRPCLVSLTWLPKNGNKKVAVFRQGWCRARPDCVPHHTPDGRPRHLQCDRKHSTDRAHASCRRSIANLRTSRSSAPS